MPIIARLNCDFDDAREFVTLPRTRDEGGTVMNRKLGILLMLMLAGEGIPAALAASAADYYEDALARYQASDLEGAVIQLKNALQQRSDYLAAQLLLSRLYLAQGSLNLAEASIQAANRLGADRAETDPLRARLLLMQGRLQALLDEIKPEGLAADAQAQVQACRGQALMELGRSSEAEQAFAAAQAQAPQAPVGYASMAQLRLRQNRLNEAQREAQRAVEFGPRDAEAWNVWASARQGAGDVESALQGYDYVLALDSRHLVARLAKLGLLLDLGRLDVAEGDLAYVKQQSAGDPRVMLLNAHWLAQRGDTVAAKAQMKELGDLLKTVRDDDLVRTAHLLLMSGFVHYSLGEYERARQDLTRYLERIPDHVGARKLLAFTYLQLGAPRQALGVLEPALKLAGTDYQLLALLGVIYRHTGDQVRATEMLEQAAALSGGAPDVVTELADLHFAGGQPERAFEELGAAFDRAPNPFRSGMMLGAMLLRSGRAADAVKVTDRLIGLEPDNLALLNLHAMAQLGAGDAAAARTTFERALVINPGFLVAHINLAKLDLVEGRPQQALERLSGPLAAHPENVVLMHEVARIYLATAHDDEALPWLEKARSIDAGALAPRLTLIDLYLRRREPAKALAVAEEAARRAPEDLTTLAALAQSQVAAGQSDQARSTLNRMGKQAGVDVDQLLRVARLQLRAGIPTDAVELLERAHGVNPRRSDVIAAQAEAYLLLGQLKESEERARSLLSAHPDDATAYGILGDVLRRRGRFQEAAQAYKQGLALQKHVRFVLGTYRALLGAGDKAQAFALIEGWLKDHPDDREAQAALADDYVAAGQWMRVQPLLEALVAARPNDTAALNNLANVYLLIGDPRALDVARRTAAIAPEDPVVLDTLGWVLVQQGEPAQGLPHLRDAQARASRNPEVRYHLGVALARLGYQAEARRQLEQAIAAEPNFLGADDARRLLGTLPP